MVNRSRAVRAGVVSSCLVVFDLVSCHHWCLMCSGRNMLRVCSASTRFVIGYPRWQTVKRTLDGREMTELVVDCVVWGSFGRIGVGRLKFLETMLVLT